MGPLKWFLFVYILGGISFLPLLIAGLIVFAHYTLPPPKDDSSHDSNDPAHLSRLDDDKLVFKTGTDDLAEKFHRKHDADVAAGYFAVCREYVPGGVNGKPPDRLSPAGEVVANESPSVYQTMYRSIFDRSQKPTIEPNKDGAGKVKKANNIFYVVLRHGHLMLYDDIQQIEVRYVISLDYHDVDIYAGNDEIIPEGELWAKRHAIRLKRKKSQTGDKATSLPFFLFSDNMSEKEDFYHALLKNQQLASEDVPVAEEFDVKHIVTLVQKLHSSEEQLQTRWLNALIGRLFLAVYKTQELEDFIRKKLMKKMSKVKKPNFITRLTLLKMHTGSGAPFFTNPRLKDLTVNGDCTAEADVDYSGNFRIEVGATAEIDLGTRFKKREVELVLAVTVKRLQGHGLIRIKPPPSNRVWITFEKMPQLDLAVEPIVSSRPITYSIILRAIESRIREVLAESMVLPFWDDIPFIKTETYFQRGGIWAREKKTATPADIKSDPQEVEPEIEAAYSGTSTPDAIHLTTKDDRIMSMPVLSDTKKGSLDRKSLLSMNTALSSGVDKGSAAKPRVFRSTSFATAADPQITANNIDGDALRPENETTPKRDLATSALKDLSTRTGNGSPPGSQGGSPPVDSAMAAAMKARSDSSVSQNSNDGSQAESTPQGSVDDLHMTPTATRGSRPATPSDSAQNSRPNSLHAESKEGKNFAQAARSLTSADRKAALASAAAAAQKWSTMGWGVLAKNKQKTAQPGNDASKVAQDGTPSAPMGRGHPLPPPGVPLPGPQKSMMGFGMPKRKPVLPPRPNANGSAEALASKASPSPTQKPPLPERRRRQSSRVELSQEDVNDEVLVVEAPAESAPTSPAADVHQDDFFGHTEESNEVGNVTDHSAQQTTSTTPPQEEPPVLSQDNEVDDPNSAQPVLGDAPPTPGSVKRKPIPRRESEDVERPASAQRVEETEQERYLMRQEAASIGIGDNG